MKRSSNDTFSQAKHETTACAVRVMLPERYADGDTNIRRVQPIDSAAWIWKAGEERNRNCFLFFHKTFTSDGHECRIHVSADERYLLSLDGERIARGPERGDIAHWTYKTYDLELPAGKHTISAVVWRIGENAPLAQLSWPVSGGFILKAEGRYDEVLTTGVADWDVARLPDVDWTAGHGFGVGRHVVIRGNSPLLATPPQSAFEQAIVVRAAINASGDYGVRSPGWALYPSSLPDQLDGHIRPGRIVALADIFDEDELHVYTEADGANPALAAWNSLLQEDATPLQIPAHTSATLVWNLGNYHCAYYEISVSGGTGATLKWSWAESMFHGDDPSDKRDRDTFIGKRFEAPGDTFHPDGSPNCTFTHPWWSAGKWCRIMVKTGDAPLTVNSIDLFETHYPFNVTSSFVSSDESLQAIEKIAVRGMEMCSHEMGFDCPYYEQQMYPGDTRIQLLVQNMLSSDDRLIRRAIELFDFSRRSDGSVGFNYPTRGMQDGWTYTMVWPLMLGDYARWHDNTQWLKARLPGLRHTMSGLTAFENDDGLLDKLSGWSFMDWVPKWSFGVAPDGYGCNCINNLFYAYALRDAALVESVVGEPELAAMFARKAKSVGRKIVSLFWDRSRGLLADTLIGSREKQNYSEHCQCLAILLDILPKNKATRATKELVNATDLARCTVYFSHYLFETYTKIGRPDLILKRFDLWRSYVKNNMRTPLEAPDPSRSDCHAWGAHPLYHMHASIAGVRPAMPLFKSVLVAPQPGMLKFIKSVTPHPKGEIKLDLSFSDAAVTGTVELPNGVTGLFVWQGKTIPLSCGINTLPSKV